MQNTQFFGLGMCNSGQAMSIRGYRQRNEETSQLELIHVISSISNCADNLFLFVSGISPLAEDCFAPLALAITLLAAWYIYRELDRAKPAVVYERGTSIPRSRAI
jgi:hypothetical protein